RSWSSSKSPKHSDIASLAIEGDAILRGSQGLPNGRGRSSVKQGRLARRLAKGAADVDRKPCRQDLLCLRRRDCQRSSCCPRRPRPRGPRPHPPARRRPPGAPRPAAPAGGLQRGRLSKGDRRLWRAIEEVVAASNADGAPRSPSLRQLWEWARTSTHLLHV